MIIALILWMAGPIDPVVGQTRPLQVPRTEEQFKIDGDLSEAAWSRALHFELGYEVNPGENIPAPVKTEAFITYNESYFLVGFVCHDPDPSAILARFRDHDQIFDDDWVGIAIDTFNDQKRAYEMIVNPLGIQMDAINDDITNNYDTSWNAIWESAGRIHSRGYTVELAIPFNQIRFQKKNGKQIWRFDCFRRYPRKIHHHIGTFPRDRNNPNYLSQTIQMEGFEGIKPGKNLQLTPTLTYSNLESRLGNPNGPMVGIEEEAEAGISGRWSINSSITLNAAINPDFSQVEADAVQLGINEQFALYFNETRPFFKEGSDYFSTPLNLLHTRTIVDPSVALKVTGKSGIHTYGFLSARDDVTNVIHPGSFGSSNGHFDQSNTSSAGRYRFDFGDNSTAGVMVTSRSGGGYENHVGAADLNWRLSKNDEVVLHLATSDTRYNEAMQDHFKAASSSISGQAIYLRVKHIKRSYGIWGGYDRIGSDFRADLGYQPQVGMERMSFGSEYKMYFDNDRLINEFGFGGDWDRTDQVDGQPIENEIEGWAWISGRYRSNFNAVLVSRTRTFAEVEYDQISWYHSGSMSPFPFMKFNYEIRGGDWIDFSHARASTFFSYSPGFDLYIGKHLSMEFDYNFYQMDVDQGYLYKTEIKEVWLNYLQNDRFRIRAILQFPSIRRNQEAYDREISSLEEELFSQILVSYKVNPQTVAYLGYSDNYLETDWIDRTQMGRQVFAKLSYAWIH